MIDSEFTGFQQIYVIVNFGLGSKVMHKAKKSGILGCTTCLGKGTVDNKYLNLFSVYDVRKEIVMMVTDNDTANKALEALNSEFKFEKPNHGIAFSMQVCGIAGTKNYKCDNIKKERGNNVMYQSITVIVDKGKAEDVIDAATKAGSKGGTIINARGSGIHETAKLFSMDIEPEKEIVIILTRSEKTQDIVDSIKSSLNMDQPGNGIIFIKNIEKVYGIYE